MKKTSLVSWMVGFGLINIASAFATEIPHCPNRENIASSRMAGTWITDQTVDSRLDGGLGEPGLALIELNFVEDPGALANFKSLGAPGNCAFEAGWMRLEILKNGKRRVLSSPYAISSQNGNPALFFDEDGEFDGTPEVTDLHSGNFMFVRADRREQDLLFVGGDRNNQRLHALKRK